MKTFEEFMEIQNFSETNRKTFKLCTAYWFGSFVLGVLSVVINSMTVWGIGVGLFIVGAIGFIGVYFLERKRQKEASA